MVDFSRLEGVAEELISIYDIYTPPIPIEIMLQQPKENMWEEVDITQLSSTFLRIGDAYSPRMSFARLLARHVSQCQWGQERGLDPIFYDAELLHLFGRMLIMPRKMILALSSGARTPTAMSVHFEVPEEDAQIRLDDLTHYK